MTITANNLRTKGIKALQEMLDRADEVYISLHGKKEYVVLKSEDYAKLKSYERDIACLEVMRDIEADDYKVQSADAHIRCLKDVLRDD